MRKGFMQGSTGWCGGYPLLSLQIERDGMPKFMNQTAYIPKRAVKIHQDVRMILLSFPGTDPGKCDGVPKFFIIRRSMYPAFMNSFGGNRSKLRVQGRKGADGNFLCFLP